MNITVNVARGTSWSGTPTPVSAAYVALYDKTLTQVANKANLVSTVQGYLSTDKKRGLILAYGSNVVAGQSGHFVWDPTLNSGNGGGG